MAAPPFAHLCDYRVIHRTGARPSDCGFVGKTVLVTVFKCPLNIKSPKYVLSLWSVQTILALPRHRKKKKLGRAGPGMSVVYRRKTGALEGVRFALQVSPARGGPKRNPYRARTLSGARAQAGHRPLESQRTFVHIPTRLTRRDGRPFIRHMEISWTARQLKSTAYFSGKHRCPLDTRVLDLDPLKLPTRWMAAPLALAKGGEIVHPRTIKPRQYFCHRAGQPQDFWTSELCETKTTAQWRRPAGAVFPRLDHGPHTERKCSKPGSDAWHLAVLYVSP